MVAKIKGVKTIDFKFVLIGHGVVNGGGNPSLQGEDGKTVKNHSIPKLRGFSNKSGRVKEENGFEYLKRAEDINLKETPAYVSDNCLKHHLYKAEMPFHLGKLEEKHARMMLLSPVGWLRGYSITVAGANPIMRGKSVMLEDAVDTLHNGNFEVFSTASSRNSETGGFFTKTTLGDTKYEGYGSINLENLQFVSLDGLFGRSAMPFSFSEEDALQMVPELEEMLLDLTEDESLKPRVEYNPCWVRKGSCMEVGEAGFLLNEDGVKVLVEVMLEKFRTLYINQGKGWLKTQELTVDYNDGQPMRIKEGLGFVNDTWTNEVAVYYAPGTEENLAESKRQIEVMNDANKKGRAAKKKKSKKEED